MGWSGGAREGERAKGVEKRLGGDLKYKGARCTAGLCAREAVAIATSHGDRVGVSGVFLDVDYIGRDREREWG